MDGKMTEEEALEAFKNLYNDIDKDNHLFVGTINPEIIMAAIEALEYKIATRIITKSITIE